MAYDLFTFKSPFNYILFQKKIQNSSILHVHQPIKFHPRCPLSSMYTSFKWWFQGIPPYLIGSKGNKKIPHIHGCIAYKQLVFTQGIYFSNFRKFPHFLLIFSMQMKKIHYKILNFSYDQVEPQRRMYKQSKVDCAKLTNKQK